MAPSDLQTADLGQGSNAEAEPFPSLQRTSSAGGIGVPEMLAGLSALLFLVLIGRAVRDRRAEPAAAGEPPGPAVTPRPVNVRAQAIPPMSAENGAAPPAADPRHKSAPESRPTPAPVSRSKPPITSPPASRAEPAPGAPGKRLPVPASSEAPADGGLLAPAPEPAKRFRWPTPAPESAQPNGSHPEDSQPNGSHRGDSQPNGSHPTRSLAPVGAPPRPSKEATTASPPSTGRAQPTPASEPRATSAPPSTQPQTGDEWEPSGTHSGNGAGSDPSSRTQSVNGAGSPWQNRPRVRRLKALLKPKR